MRLKLGLFSLFAVSYLLVFAGIALLLQHVDLTRYFELVQGWLQSGMLIHLCIAALMVGWGLLLLKNSDENSGASRGWLLLAMPCPVCLTVILFSMALLLVCFPGHLARTVLLFYLTFMAVSLLTSGAVRLLHRGTPAELDGFLGGAMLLLAAYFLLSAVVMPQFGDLDQIYRMAGYTSEAGQIDARSVICMALLVVPVFGIGYGFTTKTIRSKK